MDILDRYKIALDRVHKATINSGRRESDVRMLPVSKTADLTAMVSLAKIGVKSFGESRQQDASTKLLGLRNAGFCDVEIEFIGRLQKNKLRKIIAEFSLIHSVDSIDIAKRIADISDEMGVCKDILIQLNLAEEQQKGGVYYDSLDELVEVVLGRSGVRLRGFMLIPPIADSSEHNKRYFITAKEIFDKYKSKISTIDTLSMGMSDDFEIAVAEGSTVVRIGSSIFS